MYSVYIMGLQKTNKYSENLFRKFVLKVLTHKYMFAILVSRDKRVFGTYGLGIAAVF